MKVISTLPKIHKYLKNKDTDENEQICILLDGMSFNQNNKFSSLLQRVAQISNKVKELQLSLIGVESKDDDLLTNLRLLNKLNFEELEFILCIQDFVWNESKFCLQYFVRFVNEIIEKQTPKKFTIKLDKKSKICITRSSLYIKFINSLKQTNISEILLLFTKLVKNMQLKNINKLSFIFKDKFTKNKESQQLSNLNYLLSIIGAFPQIQQSSIRFRIDQSQQIKQYTNFQYIFNLKNSQLQNANLITYDEYLSDILQSSENLSDQQHTFNIFRKKENYKYTVLSKKDKKLTLNLDVKPLNQISKEIDKDKLKSISKTIDSWCIKKLNDLAINLYGKVINEEIIQSLSNFISKQLSTKQFFLSFDCLQLFGEASFQQCFIQLLKSLNPLKQLIQLYISIKSDPLEKQLVLTFAQQFQLSDSLKIIKITFSSEFKFLINQFVYLFQIMPNLENLEISSIIKGQKLHEISLKSSTLKINSECNLDNHFLEVFESLNEEKFKIKQKQLFLIVNITGIARYGTTVLNGNLQNISLKFIDIDININIHITFDIDFTQEIKRNRRFSLKRQNQIILYKEFKKKIQVAIYEGFHVHLLNLNPTNNVQQITPVKRLASYIKKRIDMIKKNKENSDKLVLNKPQNTVNSEQMQLQDVQEINIQELQQIILASVSDQMQNEQIQRRKWKRKPLSQYTQVQIPKMFEKIMELIFLCQEYENCKLDLSKLYYPELIQLIISQNIQFPEIFDLSLPKMGQGYDYMSFRKFFQSFFKKTKQLKFSTADYQISNYGVINLFYTLQKLKNRITHLDLNLSSTSVKKRGLISLCLKISKLPNLKLLRINIGNTHNANSLKPDILTQILKQANHQIHPDLEEFCIKASSVRLNINQEFYNMLGEQISNISRNLKSLKLKFSYNTYLQSSVQKFLESFKNLPQSLKKLSLNFQQYQQHSQDFLFSFCQIFKFIQHLQLQELVIKTSNNRENILDVVQYTNLLIIFFKQINKYQFNKLVIEFFNFNLILKNYLLKFNTNKGVFNFINTISRELKQKFIYKLSEFIFNSSPNIILDKQSIQLLDTKFGSNN